MMVGLLTVGLLLLPGDPAAAARLAGAARACSETSGIALSGVEERRWRRLEEGLSAALGPGLREAALAAGAALDLADAAAAAIAACDAIPG